MTQRMIDYYAERARGGVGLINIESVYVLEKDRDFGRLGIENPQLQVGLAELAESIQEQGARSFLQLNHRGSALSIHKGKGPDELSLEEIDSLIEAFSVAASAGPEGRVRRGGDPWRQYLPDQPISVPSDQSSNGTGTAGGWKGAEFPCGHFPAGAEKSGGRFSRFNFRMAGHEYTDGGLSLDRCPVHRPAPGGSRSHALHVSAGSPVVPYWHVPPWLSRRGLSCELAAEIRKAVKIPVIAVGRINDPLSWRMRSWQKGKPTLWPWAGR